MIIRRALLALRLINRRNIAKGFAALKRGQPSAILFSFRNLIAHEEAVAMAAAGFQENKQRETFAPYEHPVDAPLVTIVIPCFNYGSYVAEAVESALAQTFRDLEVIVVDGGSTDGTTPDRVRSLEGKSVRVFMREGRHLAGDNRNFGISQCRSPYVVCLDADDTLHPTYVEKALFLTEHLGFDVVSTGLRLFGERSGTVGILPNPALHDMINGNHVNTCALFRRDLWERVGGFHDYGLGADHAAEDWDFWIRLAAAGARFGNISGEFLLNYRVHETHSLSSGPGVPDLAFQRRRILDRNEALIDRDALSRSKFARDRNLRAATPNTALTEAMCQTPPVLSKRTILFAIPFFLVGGAERLLTQVARELTEQGWRVVIVSTVFQEIDPTDAIDWFEDVTSEVYALPRFLHPAQWTAFVDYLFASRRFDALLVAGSSFFYESLPELSKRHPDLAIVDFLFNTSGHVVSHRTAMDLLSGVLCENAEVRDWCVAAGWQSDKIALVESSIDVQAYVTGPRPAELVEHLGIVPDEIVVGFSGRLSKEKAPEVFVEVAKLCRSEPRLRFVMTGGGALADAIERRVAQAPAGTRIDLCGVVDDVKSYFTLYDVFVLPSFIDGRPIAILEALASGCAVVASRVGGLPALVEDGVNGYLVSPGDAQAIASHLMALAADPTRLAAFKLNSRQRAEETLDWRAADAPYARAISAAVERAQVPITSGAQQARSRAAPGRAEEATAPNSRA